MIGGKLEHGDVMVEVEEASTYNVAPLVRPGQQHVGVLRSGEFYWVPSNYSVYEVPGTTQKRIYPGWTKTGPDAYNNYKYSLNGKDFGRLVIGYNGDLKVQGTPGKYYSLLINITTWVTAMPGNFDYIPAPPARMNLYATNGIESQDVLIARSGDIKPNIPANRYVNFHPGKRVSQVELKPVAPMPTGKTRFRIVLEHDYTWRATRDIWLPFYYYGGGNPLPPQLAMWELDYDNAHLYEEDFGVQPWTVLNGASKTYNWRENEVTVTSGATPAIRARITIPEGSGIKENGAVFSFTTNVTGSFSVTVTNGGSTYSKTVTGPRVVIDNIPAACFANGYADVTINASHAKWMQLYADIDANDTDGYNFYRLVDKVASVSDIQISRHDSQVGTCNVVLRDDTGIDTSDVFGIGKRIRVRTNTRPGEYEGSVWGNSLNPKSVVFTGLIHTRKASYPGTARPEVSVLATDGYSDLLTKKGYAFKSLENYNRMLPYLGIPTVTDGNVVTPPMSNDPNQSITGHDDYEGLWRLKDESGNMTVLDALTLTRNSQFGYVWFDRFNRCNVMSSMPAEKTVFTDQTPGEGEFSFSNVDLQFSTDNIINFVSVVAYDNVITIDDKGEIKDNIVKNEFAMSDTESINKNRKAEYKLEMFVIPDYDDIQTKILDKYKEPVVTARTLRFPVRTMEELSEVCLFEPYRLINIEYKSKLDTEFRVLSIRHSIKPGKTWVTELGFGLSHDSALW